SITGSATLTVTPPSSTTHLLVSAPASTTAGAAFSFTVTALDANNNTVAAYTGTVHFTSSDAQAALPADYTFTNTDSGVHGFSATLKTGGSQSLTGTDTVNSGITGSQSGITVNPATNTPAAPSNLTAAAVSASQIKLAWTDNSNPPNLEEDNFRLFRSTDQTNWSWFATVGRDVTSYTWSGTAAATTYSFYITASVTAGDSPASNTATVTTPAVA